MKRLLIIALCLLMTVALFAGCGTAKPASSAPADQSASQPAPDASTPADEPSTEPAEPAEPENDSVYPLVTDDSVTLSIWLPLQSAVSAYTTDLADGSNYAWSGAMEATGINIEFLMPSDTMAAENLNMLVASSEYPDIICNLRTFYTGGAVAAVEQGVCAVLTEYLVDKNLAPNYMARVNADEANVKDAKSDSGDFLGFSHMYDRPQSQFQGYLLRGDWLDELNMELPTTIDEWHTILTAFKTEKTDGVAPMDLRKTGMPNSDFFLGAYGACNHWFAGNQYFIQKDGKVEFSAINDGFRKYLELMSAWYAEGLIDPDFTDNDNEGWEPNYDRLALDVTGATNTYYTYAGDFLAKNGMAVEGANFVVPYIPKENADDPIYCNTKFYETLVGVDTGISTTCEDIGLAVQFIDYFYSDEGVMLGNYGVEGVTFNYVDGVPVQTELITNNPDGMSTTYAQIRYLIHSGFTVFMLDREELAQNDESKKYVERWAGRGIYNLPAGLSMTMDESATVNNLMGDISTYVGEFVPSVITGAVKLDDASWENYVNEIKGMNVADAEACLQAAFDRYQVR